MAPVGQASMHKRHWPQRSAGKDSGIADGRSQIERRDDDAEKKPRAELFVDQHRIFGEPAEAGMARRNALDDWAGIDVSARVEIFAKFAAHRGDELL